jgi:hypothetical protein
MSDEDFCPPMLTEEELTDLLLSVHSVRDLMSVKVVKGTSTNETSQDDSLFDELEKEDPETGDNIDPLNNTTEPQNGLNDIFGLNEGNGGIGNLTDPLDTTTPPEDGVNGQEEEEEGNNPFNLEGEDNSLGKLEDPIITVTSGEDGIED